MGSQIGTRPVETIVEFQIQMVCLQVGEDQDGRDGAGKLAETIENVLGLKGDARLEFVAVGPRAAADARRILLTADSTALFMSGK